MSDTKTNHLTQPVKWHGGKAYLAHWIIGHMPPHTLYREPFFGGGAVLWRKPCEGIGEAVNDIHYDLTNFWSVLRSEQLFKRFTRNAETIPLSEVEWERSKNDLRLDEHGEDVWAAVRFFVRYRQSRQGLGKDFATPTTRTRRGMNENVSAWLSAVDGLPEAHARLRRVEIRNMDACDFIRKYDAPHALFYCDPPYLHETRSTLGAYEHEMTAEDHQRLLTTLAAIEGKFLLSGYRSELYEGFCRAHGWQMETKEIDNKASGAKLKEKKIECLWMNY